MIKDLKDAFHLTNLHRAWLWLKTNSDAYYKNYFRHIYSAYAIAYEDNLSDLRARLIKGTFQPNHATKLYLPKKSGIQRTYTLLAVEDQIVYQALVNIIADKLFPIVKHRYYKTVFGHLYAGKKSLFFYKNWQQGHKKFGETIRKIYLQEFLYTATFDLTACYDSIDHSVLSHFLQDLKIKKEFTKHLCDFLKHWTATSTETRIYQGHGIPQGPLSSGLLSEVVLRYFDENRTKNPRTLRYFRYVDDIRFFAKNEHDLRLMLVEMDLLSKQIGLFPQSSKIGIHRIINIEDEIKSISLPPEPIKTKGTLDQLKIQNRLKKLSFRLKVVNETRFKYVLGKAEPSSRLNNRLIKILDKQPHLYNSIFNYFCRYSQIPKKISSDLFHLFKNHKLYDAFVAHGLRTLRTGCHNEILQKLEQFAKKIVEDSELTSRQELYVAAASILLVNNRMSWKQIFKHITHGDEWWSRSELITHVQIDHLGKPSYETLVNNLLQDSSVDVSLVAAEMMATNSLEIKNRIDSINPLAQISLKKIGLIKVRRSGFCPVSAAMQHMLGSRVNIINWKKLLGIHYKDDIPKIVILRAYYETDATPWINLLDLKQARF